MESRRLQNFTGKEAKTLTNFNGFKMGELDEHGRPKMTKPIKCKNCNKEFWNIVNFNKHKHVHKRYGID